ncbi:hypothetical protein BGX27_006185 [Mortierella sp. AM989]|nr:hypothetical protein BGX27_006185 [Mortierella sp. AM989]
MTLGLSQSQSLRQNQNEVNSDLVKCPPELHKTITHFIQDPLVLFRLTHTCRTFRLLIVSRDWFVIYCHRYPSWSQGCRLEDEPDDEEGFSVWKRIVVRDASLLKRLELDLMGHLSKLRLIPVTDLNHTNSESSLLPTIEEPLAMDVDPTSQAISAETHQAISLEQATTAGPPDVVVESALQQINAEDHTATVPGQPLQVPEQGTQTQRHQHIRVLLDEALYFNPDPSSASGDWRQMGSPVYHIDNNINSIIAASMLMRPTADGENWLNNRQILLYKLPDLTNPVAICGSQLWADETDNSSSMSHLMDIRHYPDTIVNGEMRVVLIVVFGLNARPATQDESDMQILDVWKLVKAVEIWIPVGPASTASTTGLLAPTVSNPWIFRPTIGPPPTLLQARKGRIEKIEPGRGEAELRGRIAKLYRAAIPKATESSLQESTSEEETEMVDCIALFGIQNSDTSSAIVIKKVLFMEDKVKGNSSFSKKQISRTVSCMALFPYYSNYERMLVLFNRHGRGLIWDWVNEKQIAQLHMPVDKILASAKSGQVDGISPDAAAAADAAARSNLYYWGAQVNWAVEVPYPAQMNPKKRHLFRIVILADGEGSEWESTWWHVDSSHLGESEKDLEAPPFIPAGHPRIPWKPSPGQPNVLYAIAKRHEDETIGYCLPDQRESHLEEDGKPLQFIAYVIWNHFRIVLTSKLGLSIYDMEELGDTPAAGSKDRQWVAFLEDTKDNPLVDIATVGDNLIITRRFGQMIWSFYGLVK